MRFDAAILLVVAVGVRASPTQSIIAFGQMRARTKRTRAQCGQKREHAQLAQRYARGRTWRFPPQLCGEFSGLSMWSGLFRAVWPCAGRYTRAAQSVLQSGVAQTLGGMTRVQAHGTVTHGPGLDAGGTVTGVTRRHSDTQASANLRKRAIVRKCVCVCVFVYVCVCVCV